MMQITVDPAKLTEQQRQAVAGFIMAYPVAGALESKREHVAPVNELEVLANEANDPTTPAQAFGITAAMDNVNEAAAAFGAPVVVPSPALQAHQVIPVTMGQTPPPASGTVPGVELDANGLPWDKRIHAEGKAKIANGTWRSKRKVDPALVVTVEAELRALMGVATPNPTLAQPAAPVTTPTAGPASLVVPAIAPPPPVNGAASSMTVAPNVAPAPPPAPSAPAVSADARSRYVALIGRTAAAQGSGKITTAQVNQVCNDFGVGALVLLAQRLDLLDQVEYAIDSLIALKA